MSKQLSEIFLDFNNESHNWVDKKTHNIFPSIKVGTLWEIKVPAGNKYHLPPDLKERGHDLGKIEGRIWTPVPLPFQASSRLYMGNLPVYHILFSGGIELSGHGILDQLVIRQPIINHPDQI